MNIFEDIANRIVLPDRYRLGIFGLVLVYLITRLWSLTRLPVLIDEAFHIWLVRQFYQGTFGAGNESGRWLTIVLTSISMRLPGDALWLARFTAVVAGLGTLLVVFLIGRELLSQRSAFLAALFYAIFPFSLFYHRLILADSLIVIFGSLILLYSVKAVQSTKAYYSLLLTILFIAAILTKFSGLLFIAIPPIAIASLLPRAEWRRGFKRVLPALIGVTLLVAFTYRIIIPWYQITSKTAQSSPGSLLQAIANNTNLVGQWFWVLLTPPFFLIVVLAFIWATAVRRDRKIWFLIFIIIVSAGPYILIADEWYPRYLTFTLVPLSLLLGEFLAVISNQIELKFGSENYGAWLSGGLVLLLLAWPITYNLGLLLQPDTVKLPEILDWEFRSGWPSGYGARELAEYIESDKIDGSNGINILRVVSWSQTTMGGLEVHMSEDSPVELTEIGTDIPLELAEARQQLERDVTVLIAIDSTHSPSRTLFNAIDPYIDADLIWHDEKPGTTDGMELWQINAIDMAG